MAKEVPLKKFDLRRFLIPILRKKSLYYPERNRALQLARVERGFYKCRACQKNFGRKEVHVDHIESVISVKDHWIDWNTYIERLFVPAESYQILCISCHHDKTQIETELRKINKKKQKVKK